MFLRQDYRGDKELLVLNDQPEQELVFAHPQVRIVNIKKSFKSLGEKRNACAALATHDWLFVWDDDDIYMPWRLSWSMRMVSRERAFFKSDRSLLLSDGVLSGPEDNLFHSSACFHRDLFDRVGGYPHMGTGEDLEFESKIADLFQVPGLEFAGHPVEKIYYIYRWGGTGSYHVSWFDGGAGGHAKVLDYVTDALRLGRLPRGRIVLEPNWKADYVDLAARYLGMPRPTAPRAVATPSPKSVFRKATAHLRALGSGPLVGQWLVHCADPLGPRTEAPHRLLSPREAQDFVAQADMHGVLATVLRQFPPFLASDPAFAKAKAEALTLHRSALAQALMLRTHADALVAAANLPVVMVKGPVFARTIYPAPSLRTFTDVDLLIAPEAEPELARLLLEAGFQLADYDRDPRRQEWKWLHRENDAVMIEVHTNLVHHPELRAAMSLSYADLAGIAETPAALLTVAAIHGALHRFERLRQVVDICQAARHVSTPEEESRFELLIERSGARLAAIAGLDFAYRLLGEPRCRELARGLGPARYTALARLLIGRSAVTSSMSKARVYHSWRRQGFRELLKRSRAF